MATRGEFAKRYQQFLKTVFIEINIKVELSYSNKNTEFLDMKVILEKGQIIKDNTVAN